MGQSGATLIARWEKSNLRPTPARSWAHPEGLLPLEIRPAVDAAETFTRVAEISMRRVEQFLSWPCELLALATLLSAQVSTFAQTSALLKKSFLFEDGAPPTNHTS